VIVPRGASLRVAADSLARAGVVQNATLFRLYATLRQGDRSIQAGTYVFKRGVSWGEVLADLMGGKGLVRSITIPEGWSLGQIVRSSRGCLARRWTRCTWRCATPRSCTRSTFRPRRSRAISFRTPTSSRGDDAAAGGERDGRALPEGVAAGMEPAAAEAGDEPKRT